MTSSRFVSRWPFVLLAGLLALSAVAAQPAELRLGMVGLDTSHVVAFTKLLNDASDKDHVAGAKVVAGVKGGSPDVAASATRVDGYTKELVEKWGIKLYDRIEDMAKDVDGILIESVDGRTHLEQARRALPFKKPVFIDKPVAGSLRDAIEIFRLARQYGTPVFSASPLRAAPGVVAVRKADIGKQMGAFSYGPATLEPHHPDLFWYAIHATEMLFTVMGRGCENVSRTQTADTEIVTGVWSDGRVGTVRGNRGGKAEYGVTIFGSTANAESKPTVSYPSHVGGIVKFLQTGVAPASPADTLEIIAFMEAADESKRRGGAPVSLAEVMKANGGSPDLLK